MEGSCAKDFGKELGMIHEGIIALRNLGLSAKGWQKMADDKDLAQKVVELVEGQKEMWLEKILARERACHIAFFGQEFDLTTFANTLKKYGESKIRFWQKLGLEPGFLPAVSLGQNNNYSGWKTKSEKWFYEKIAEGKIFRDIAGKLVVVNDVKLEGAAVLVDARCKPAYKDGKQMWDGDEALGLVIQSLRKAGRIAKYEYGPQSSRFGVSADEWEAEIKFLWAEKLQLKAEQLRLEIAEEANVIPQVYPYMSRKADGQTNTWVWYEQYFVARGFRLFGGYSGFGGLADIDCDAADDRWGYRSFRPLAVL